MRERLLAPSSAVFILVAACVLGCASTGPGAGEGRDAEGNRVVLDGRGNARIPADRQPTNDELDEAFAAPSAQSDAAAAALGTPVEPPALPPDAQKREAEAAAFEAEAKRVESLLTGRKLPPEQVREGALAAEALEARAQALGPRPVQRALALRVKAALAQQDHAAAHDHAWRWLLACGPEDVDACRRAALTAAGRTARGAAKPKEASARVTHVRNHDACLRQAERAGRRKGAALPGCLDRAADFYRSERDRLMSARVLLAKADSKSRTSDAAALPALERAAAFCTEARCRDVRRSALQRTVDVALQSAGAQPSPKALEVAARAALADVALNAERLPASQRAWAWTQHAERACSAYDAVKGVGACRKLERQTLGRNHYSDFSLRPAGARGPAGDGLSPDQVRAVSAHYAPSLEPCLAAQAARLHPPAQEQYTVRWVVANDGRVSRMQMDKRELQDGPLASCLREALGLWRYPRFGGELQHVEQSFGVTARPAGRG